MTRVYSPAEQRHALMAGFLGWTLDAFDFFILVFMLDRVATDLGVTKAAIVATLGATLAMRPVGALVFGLLADRYGRRRPLMANVVYFSIVEVACGFAPNYTVFLVLRALYGIGMGGEWGVGASLAMEIAPRRRRGLLSGILQSGYSIGYLLAALCARFVLPAWGWRAMFFVGGVPALLALYIRMRVPESDAWRQHRAPTVGALLRTVAGHGRTFLYLVVLMSLMLFLAHGSQDLYPDFLRTGHGLVVETISSLAILASVGAVAGAVVFGLLSESGRRRSMLVALGLVLAVIPFWAFGQSVVTLAAGAFLLSFGVQGAWGVIPAHLNELAPDSARGLMPGLAYQLGILLASPTNSLQFALAGRLGYPWALALFEGTVVAALALVLLLGSEQRGRDFQTGDGDAGMRSSTVKA
ncbi:MAG TPA: MFS transporter [Patescibacteria group bacterium]|nr:MFS transporter [Patescibacteria group bacterium]